MSTSLYPTRRRRARGSRSLRQCCLDNARNYITIPTQKSHANTCLIFVTTNGCKINITATRLGGSKDGCTRKLRTSDLLNDLLELVRELRSISACYTACLWLLLPGYNFITYIHDESTLPTSGFLVSMLIAGEKHS